MSRAFVVCVATDSRGTSCKTANEASRELAQHILATATRRAITDWGRSFFVSARDYDKEELRRAVRDIEKTAIKMVASKLKEQAAALAGERPWLETERDRQAKRDAIRRWENEATREAEYSQNWSYSDGGSFSFTAGAAYSQLQGLASGSLRW